MKSLAFGDNLPTTGGLYLNLKEKGDQVTFRIAKEPVYTGKHFRKEDDKWLVTNCPRINEPELGIECNDCTTYFGIMNEAKKVKETNKTEYEKLYKQAREFNAAISFYFPILNRDEKKFQILRTTVGIRNKLNEEFQAGIDILQVDWVLRNTGSPSPRDRYSLVRLDSLQSKPLDEKEEAELDKARKYDMNQITDRVSPAETEEEDLAETVSKTFK